ncbi:MAG: hypothetical protein RJB66_350 [Pseudomonadota bacterium]|jgi:prepilin-type N-terminal cleavage/methylation domain-containing protein
MFIKNQKAMTLIEILVVLAILGVLAVAGVQRLRRTENLRTAVRQLSTVLKKTRGFSKLSGKTYRLVFKKDDKEGDSYWAESSNQTHLIDPKADDKYKLSMDKEKEEELQRKASGGFQPATDIIKKPKTLPKGWSFAKIESSGNPEKETGDMTFVYFFPQGVSEEAIIQLTNKNKTTWTIHLNPLLSSPDIFEEEKVLKDFAQ